MISFGIIGSGMIADYHAKAIQAIPNACLTGIYSRNGNKAKELADKFSCKSYSNINKFLSSKDIDIVTVATPSGTHMEMAIAAAKAGKHIICEKPLEINVDRIDQMIKVALENNVVLGGIFNRRFNPAVSILKKAIDQKRFGKLTLCDAQIRWYRTQEYYDSGQWRGTWELDGGGALMNQSIHTIDLLLYFAGPVKRVSASVATLAHKNIEVEDTAVAILEFQNGAIGSIQGSTACWSSSGHPSEINICGENGSVFMADENFTIWDFKSHSPDDSYVRENLMNNSRQGLGANDPNAINFLGHQKNFENVIKAIEDGGEPLVTGYEARKAVQLINAIYKSAQNNGNWIRIE